MQEDFLDEVRLRNLRGIRNLRVAFDYPVSVIAGPNGCGKSTVLFACAAAYAPAGRSGRTYTPAALFPGFAGGEEGALVDEAGDTGLEFYYLAGGVRYSMVWKKGSVVGQELHGPEGHAAARERAVPCVRSRTLTNPSEVRGILQLGRGALRGGRRSRPTCFCSRDASCRRSTARRLADSRAQPRFSCSPGWTVARSSATPSSTCRAGETRHPADVEGHLRAEARTDPHRRGRGGGCTRGSQAAAYVGAAAHRVAQRPARWW